MRNSQSRLAILTGASVPVGGLLGGLLGIAIGRSLGGEMQDLAAFVVALLLGGPLCALVVFTLLLRLVRPARPLLAVALMTVGAGCAAILLLACVALGARTELSGGAWIVGYLLASVVAYTSARMSLRMANRMETP